jgi:hypothetical protein
MGRSLSQWFDVGATVNERDPRMSCGYAAVRLGLNGQGRRSCLLIMGGQYASCTSLTAYTRLSLILLYPLEIEAYLTVSKLLGHLYMYNVGPMNLLISS